MRWDEERFGREYDLDTFMIFCADDFNLGAMENKGLNIFNSRLLLADPATATDDDFSADRGGDRARILPQLDRQPRHVPRLVPAVAERGPHRLSRPGILERPGLARRRAHRRRRVPATRAVRRGRRPDGAPGAPGRVPGDQQLLYGDRLRERRRADPDAACAAWRRPAFAAGWISTSRVTTDRPSPATSSCSRCRMRPASISRSSATGIRRPERRLSPCAAATMRRRGRTCWTSSRACPPRPAAAADPRFTYRSRSD